VNLNGILLMPLMADEEGVRLAGHARVAAAAKLGLTYIRVMVARGLERRYGDAGESRRAVTGRFAAAWSDSPLSGRSFCRCHAACTHVNQFAEAATHETPRSVC
jgi:hypothetical protein